MKREARGVNFAMVDKRDRHGVTLRFGCFATWSNQ